MKLVIAAHSARFVPAEGMIDARVVIGQDLIMAWTPRDVGARELSSLDSGAAQTRGIGGEPVLVPRRPK